ncbi:FAD-dependent oxidoreductase [Pedobacter insulae]|uniref:FAD dependent oxidoreductase n=1 Tax=Pedobacter insulae TaxID=414048 RepID=A0A1I2ZQG0_9SPHI|nr:FAD-dependent oxidoreductase [Pedobacter insulae]SFH39940.1 FAD dependent oxidoreductase [Pedobacter insulae]
MKEVRNIFIILLLFVTTVTKANINAYEIIVYGATPSGVAAAIAAAREGKKVLIIEPLNIVGGMMSGGLSFSDSNQTARESLGGIFEEIHLRIEKIYKDKGIKLPYEVAVKDNRKWMYEPHVAERVFLDMLREEGVPVMLNETLKSAKKEAARIVSIKMYSGKKFTGKVFIDASYEGDLLAAAGVSYSIGREARTTYDESLAGAIYPKEKVSIKATDNKGKLLPFINSNKLSPEGEGDHRIMTYSFRLCLSSDPDNQVPFTKPVNYDPNDYAIFKSYYQANPNVRTPIDFYPLPNKKFDGNNGISLQLSSGLVGENYKYPEAKPKQRQKIWKAHQDFTEGLLYFLQNDESMPAPIHKQMATLGYAKDEFAATNHFPPVLYVREGRRMNGAYFLTQKDILENVEKADAIGIGSFPIDSHDCQRIATADGGFINEGTIFPVHVKGRYIGQPHQIPYRAITPKAEECVNLLVPVSLSASHVAFSSIRVEPTWIVLGQSAGIAAAMAVEEDKNVQNLNYANLAKRLKMQKQVLELPILPKS